MKETLIEKKSRRKKEAIMLLVENGEYSKSYALWLIEELNDSGKLLDNDYEELYEWLTNEPTEENVEPVEEVEEIEE